MRTRASGTLVLVLVTLTLLGLLVIRRKTIDEPDAERRILADPGRVDATAT